MPLEQLVSDEAFWGVALSVDKGYVVIDIADPRKLICVSVVMDASFGANEEDGDVRPRQAQ